ncbi:hypothetical protein B0T09DRAFT_361368 [Sordaria sp. MPI-SDFR-AT-0083]|nr:hypothetical protein B0T09DRAFT_361368 [Sordaria sp. MPI-SDFR-AT-0083]
MPDVGVFNLDFVFKAYDSFGDRLRDFRGLFQFSKVAVTNTTETPYTTRYAGRPGSELTVSQSHSFLASIARTGTRTAANERLSLVKLQQGPLSKGAALLFLNWWELLPTGRLSPYMLMLHTCKPPMQRYPRHSREL